MTSSAYSVPAATFTDFRFYLKLDKRDNLKTSLQLWEGDAVHAAFKCGRKVEASELFHRLGCVHVP